MKRILFSLFLFASVVLNAQSPLFYAYGTVQSASPVSGNIYNVTITGFNGGYNIYPDANFDIPDIAATPTNFVVWASCARFEVLSKVSSSPFVLQVKDVNNCMAFAGTDLYGNKLEILEETKLNGRPVGANGNVADGNSGSQIGMSPFEVSCRQNFYAVQMDSAIMEAGGTPAWSLTGNAGTTPGTNFIGTTDNQDLVFKRNGIEIGYYKDTSVIVDGYNNFNRTLSTGTNNFIGGGSGNFKSNLTGGTNGVGAGVANFPAGTALGGCWIGAGDDNYRILATGGNNLIGAGRVNCQAMTSGANNLIGAGFTNLRATITGSNNCIGGGRSNIQFVTQADNTNIGAGYNNLNGASGTISNINIGAGNTNMAGVSTLSNICIVGSNSLSDVTTLDNTSLIGNNVRVNKSNQVVLGGTGTTEVKFRGETGYNYGHDVSTTLGAAQDGYVWTYDNTTSSIKMKAPAGGSSSTKQYQQFNIVDTAVDLSADSNTAEGFVNLTSGDFTGKLGKDITVFVNGVKHEKVTTPSASTNLSYTIAGTTLNAFSGISPVTINQITIEIK